MLCGRKRSAATFVGLFAAATVAFSFSVRAEPAASLRVAVTSKSLIYAPVYVALNRGFFEQEGLKLELLDAGAGTKVAAGLAGGSIGAAMMAIDHVFAATTQAQKWVMLGQLMNKEPYTFAMRKDVAEAKKISTQSPFAERLKALEGASVAVSSLGSGTQLALASAMSKAGAAPERVRWVPIGDPLAIVTALEHKQVDVGGRAPGPAEIIVDRGAGIMLVDFSRDQTGETYPTIVVATTEQQIKDKSAELGKLMRGLRKGLNFIREHPQEAALTIRRDFKSMDDKAFEAGFAFDVRSLPEDVLISKPEFDRAVSQANSEYLLKARRGLKVSDDYETSVDIKIGGK